MIGTTEDGKTVDMTDETELNITSVHPSIEVINSSQSILSQSIVGEQPSAYARLLPCPLEQLTIAPLIRVDFKGKTGFFRDILYPEPITDVLVTSSCFQNKGFLIIFLVFFFSFVFVCSLCVKPKPK